MSDNDDILGDDLGDHSLADYNLGNEEEEQLLADDYEGGGSQNVPPSAVPYYEDTTQNVHSEYASDVEFSRPPQPYISLDTESVVPNITVEIPNVPVLPQHRSFAPYDPSFDREQAVPPAIPVQPVESPQTVPSEINANGDMRDRFNSERPPGAQRLPQVRDIPDSLDKVIVPGGVRGPRWRPVTRHRVYRRPEYVQNPYSHRPQFPSPNVRSNIPQHIPNPMPEPPQFGQATPPNRPDLPQNRPEIPQNRPDIPQVRPDLQIRPEIPQVRPEMPQIRPEVPEIRRDISNLRPPRPQIRFRPDMPMSFGPDGRIERLQMPPDVNMPPEMQMQRPFRPHMERFPHFNQNFPPDFGPPRANFPFQQRPPFGPFGPRNRPEMPRMGPMPMRPGIPGQMEPEVRMLPLLPQNLPPGGLAVKKVLINPHFKGNFQPPPGAGVKYVPTKIQKSPPRSPPLAPIKDIDEAAERFIAEQRSALARAAQRKIPRRSPTRYIENTTIEIENDLARSTNAEEDELSRKQRQFIEANRAGLRRRMRSPSPPRRSPSPRRSRSLSPKRARELTPRNDEESEYRRKVREQETLRERVLRAKEQRRRKNAVALQKQIEDRERERKEREAKEAAEKVQLEKERNIQSSTLDKDKTKIVTPSKSPIRDRSPIKETVTEKPVTPSPVPKAVTTKHVTAKPVTAKAVAAKPVTEKSEITGTLTPPRDGLNKEDSPERNLTPPLPPKAKVEVKVDSDDDLDLILDDIDDMLSDDEDTGRFKERTKKAEPPKPKQVDLRSRLPPKQEKKPKQRIVFNEDKEKEKEKTPPSPPAKKSLVSSTTKKEKTAISPKKSAKVKADAENAATRLRQRIIFEKKTKKAEKELTPPTPEEKTAASSRRVVLQRRVTQTVIKADKEKSVFSRIEFKADPSKPNPGIFSRAVRTAIGSDSNRIVVKKTSDPEVEYESESGDEETSSFEEINQAQVDNLPFGMTDTRLRTLAGNDVQNIKLDKEARSAMIIFKTTAAAETFKKKFNNKMVAASRLTVVLK